MEVREEDQFTPDMKFAAGLSIFVSVFLFACKFAAFRLTHSQAIFSDAMESIINVLTAIVAYWVLSYAAKPADEDHPYGHGKVEYMSAGLEGGLIGFAAVIIAVEAIQAMFVGETIHSLNVGLALISFAGIINFVLGLYLKKIGKKRNSLALEASGRHLLADFWTSAGVIVGLVVVYLFDLLWLDTVIALGVSLHLVREAYFLVRKAISGLLDEEETETLEQIRDLINKHPQEGIIQIHHVRVMRAGRFHHIDAHVVVPEFWSVEEAHDQTRDYERMIFHHYEFGGEIHFHVDPCRRLYCQFCELEVCPVRKEPFKERRRVSIKELRNPDEPKLMKN